MTVYTYRQNALDLLDRIKYAPDQNTIANLNRDLWDQFIENATVMQALAESNERWAKQNRDREEVVENFIDAMAELAPEVMESDAMQELANAFDIALESDWLVSVTLTYNLSVTAPRNASTWDVKSAITWDGYPTFTANKDGYEVSDGREEQSDYEIDASRSN